VFALQQHFSVIMPTTLCI